MLDKNYLLNGFPENTNGDYVLQEAIENYAGAYEEYLGTFIENYLIKEKRFEKENALNMAYDLETKFILKYGYIEISDNQIIDYVNTELRKESD